VPGTYRGPASCAYLYYTDEHKKWVDGLQVEIAAK
jgi:alpha-2-macroglobulin-like protein